MLAHSPWMLKSENLLASGNSHPLTLSKLSYEKKWM